MITSVRDIPTEQLISCNWIIITHRLGEYLFENDRCFKSKKELSLIKCGGSIGYKINGKFRSLTWLKNNRKPYIQVMCENIKLLPF